MSTVATRNSYGTEDIDRALYWLVMSQGNYQRASKQLRDQDIRIPAKTIANWHKKDPARYEAVKARLVPEIHARLAGELEDVARASLDLQNELLEETRRQMEAGDLKNPDSAARNVATVGGIALSHVRPMRDMPSTVVAIGDVDTILNGLRRLVNAPIDATAEEITDAE